MPCSRAAATYDGGGSAGAAEALLVSLSSDEAEMRGCFPSMMWSRGEGARNTRRRDVVMSWCRRVLLVEVVFWVFVKEEERVEKNKIKSRKLEFGMPLLS